MRVCVRIYMCATTVYVYARVYVCMLMRSGIWLSMCNVSLTEFACMKVCMHVCMNAHDLYIQASLA